MAQNKNEEEKDIICLNDCPAPGYCNNCNDKLLTELLQDDAVLTTLYEWERTSGPLRDVC